MVGTLLALFAHPTIIVGRAKSASNVPDKLIGDMYMGLAGIRPLSLLLILAIILVVFGTKRIKTLGTDLGEAIKQFRRAMIEDNEEKK